MELAVKAIAHCSVSSNQYAEQLVETCLVTANSEWLSETQDERRFAAVSRKIDETAIHQFCNQVGIINDPQPKKIIQSGH